MWRLAHRPPPSALPRFLSLSQNTHTHPSSPSIHSRRSQTHALHKHTLCHPSRCLSTSPHPVPAPATKLSAALSSALQAANAVARSDSKHSVHVSPPDFFSEVPFSDPDSDLGLGADLVQSLVQLGKENPTHIQAMAIPVIVRGEHTLITAETGSGKTLCYLLPLLEKLLRGPRSTEARRYPSALIVVPNRGLAKQVLAMAEQVLSALNPTDTDEPSVVCRIIGPAEVFPDPTWSVTDVLITTPVGADITLKDDDVVAALRTCVMDEADLMLSDGTPAGDLSQRLLSRLDMRPGRTRTQGPDSKVQFVFAAATLPAFGRRTAGAYLAKRFPPINEEEFLRVYGERLQKSKWRAGNGRAYWISNPLLHRHLAHIAQAFVRVAEPQAEDLSAKGKASDKNNSDAAANTVARLAEARRIHLLATGEQEPTLALHEESGDETRWPDRGATLVSLLRGAHQSRTLIFVNTVKAAQSLYLFLQTQIGLPLAAEFHKKVRDTDREKLLQRFNAGKLPVLICTNIASRGLDFVRVDHVIEYEFAENVVDHLHRLGRAGRTSKTPHKARATSFYSSSGLALANVVIGQHACSHNRLDSAFSRKRSFRKEYKRQQDGPYTPGEVRKTEPRGKSDDELELRRLRKTGRHEEGWF